MVSQQPKLHVDALQAGFELQLVEHRPSPRPQTRERKKARVWVMEERTVLVFGSES
jgi:hypothetical protein